MIGSMDQPLHLGPVGMPGDDVAEHVRRACVVLDYLQGFRATIQAVSFDFNGVVVEVRETDRVEWVVDRYRALMHPDRVPVGDLQDGLDKGFHIGKHRADGPPRVGE